MKDQAIIREMGKVLWSIFPTDGARIEFKAQLYDRSNQCGPEWFDGNGKRLGPQSFDDYPDEANDELRSLALELQRTPPFDRQPFTHMLYELTSDGKVNLEFACIPEWDSWPGLFMKGVSELTEAEARDPAISNTWGIDYEHWEKCRARRQLEPYEK